MNMAAWYFFCAGVRGFICTYFLFHMRIWGAEGGLFSIVVGCVRG